MSRRRRRRRGQQDPPDPLHLLDVLDRILDKGIVIEAWVGVSLIGIDLLAMHARVVVASLDTYLRYAELAGARPPGPPPMGGEPTGEPPGTALPAPEAAVRAAEEYLRRLGPDGPSDPPGATLGRRVARRDVPTPGR